MPVPFFKQGLMCIAETQVIAVVNEGLEARFAEINSENSEWIDISCIPECLGNSDIERINKWLELKGKGIKLLQKDA